MIKLDLEPCLPPLWAPTGHAQTILGHLLPSPKLKNLGQRVEIDLPGGDQLIGFLTKGESTTLVYIFHGLAGSTDATYMHRTAQLALNLGHSVFMVNHRGCGAGVRLAKEPYHSGRAEDLSAVIAVGRKMFPRHRHLAIGFSLSANALLLLLSGRRGQTLPDCGIAVNAPIDLQNSADLLKVGLNKIYDIKFYIECRHGVLHGRSKDATPYSLPWLRTLHEFDNLYTAPAGGFKNREDYYTSCSTKDLLNDIKTPVFVLTAADDPFVGVEAYRKAALSPQVSLHIEKFGGHMGYLSKKITPLGGHRWQDYAVEKMVRALVSV
jgi:uncharacterized protein